MKTGILTICMLFVFILIGVSYSNASPKGPKDKYKSKTKSFESMNDVEKITFLTNACKDAERDLDFEYKFAYSNKVSDGPEKEMFREAQEAWESYYHSTMTFYISKNAGPGSYTEIALLKYKRYLIEKRILEIKYSTVSIEEPAVILNP